MFIGLEYSLENVLYFNLLMTVVMRHLLSLLNGFLYLYGEIIKIHIF